MFWVLKRTVSLRRFFWVPTTCFGWEIRKLNFRYALLTKVLYEILKYEEMCTSSWILRLCVVWTFPLQQMSRPYYPATSNKMSWKTVSQAVYNLWLPSCHQRRLPFKWRFADGPIVASFYVYCDCHTVGQCIRMLNPLPHRCLLTLEYRLGPD